MEPRAAPVNIMLEEDAHLDAPGIRHPGGSQKTMRPIPRANARAARAN